MESKRQSAPLVVIAGPTASGKSYAAMQIAKQFNGEIICADSRTIYKGMNIGTAKPGHNDQSEIKHHLLDITTPDQSFTAADFKKLAIAAIEDITSRGKLPILVGGTGLYIDGVIFDFAFLPPAPAPERERLQRLSVEELQAELVKAGMPLPENSQNPRHLIRAIETNGAVAVKKDLRDNTLVLGMDAEKKAIFGRIHGRTEDFIEQGLEEEVENLVKKYGWDAPGMSAVGYREWVDYFEGAKNLKETLADIEQSTMHYVKRQRTWLKRNPHIKWVKNSAEAVEEVKTFLQQ